MKFSGRRRRRPSRLSRKSYGTRSVRRRRAGAGEWKEFYFFSFFDLSSSQQREMEDAYGDVNEPDETPYQEELMYAVDADTEELICSTENIMRASKGFDGEPIDGVWGISNTGGCEFKLDRSGDGGEYRYVY